MRLTIFFVTALLIAGANALNAQQTDSLDARIEAISLERVFSSRNTTNTTCNTNEITQLECAVAKDNYLLLSADQAKTLLTFSVKAINELPSDRINEKVFEIAGASALAIFRIESEQQSKETATRNFALAAQAWDGLLNEAIKSAYGPIHVAMSNIYAQAYLESQRIGENRTDQTKWLTNLGNSLARASRFTRDPESSLDSLLLSTAIREEVVKRLNDASDPVRLGRALLNRGNGLVQASELLAHEGGVAAGREYIELAGIEYARGIGLLLAETDKSNTMANRLLTTLVSMHSSSMIRGAGDEYRAHRASIALLKYMRNDLKERLNSNREVDIALAELGARIQLIDRIVGKTHRLNLIEESLAILEVYEDDALDRRQEPDTGISVYSAGVSLYSFRGKINRNWQDCDRADTYWQKLRLEVEKHQKVNLRNIKSTLNSLIDCRATTNIPADSVSYTSKIIAEKERQLQMYTESDPILADTRPLFANELIYKWSQETDDGNCAAVAIAAERLPNDLFLDTPVLWHTWLTHLLCSNAESALDTSIQAITQWLIHHEKTEAESRSGQALLFRRLHQPLTDVAIVLASHKRFDDALWFLDFRDRSRDEPRVREAREKLLTAKDSASEVIAQHIGQWLRFDNPTDIENSFSLSEITDGRVVLTSEAAAKALSLDTADIKTFSTQEILSRTSNAAQNQILAWLLVGTDSSGWLVVEKEGKITYLDLDINRTWLQSLLEKKFSDPESADSDRYTFFQARRQSHEDSGDQKLSNLRRWQSALRTISTQVSEKALYTLWSYLSGSRSSESPNHLVLIVRNELADLPLHAISIGSDSTRCGPTLLDCFTVGYASDTAILASSPLTSNSFHAYWGFSNTENGLTSLAQYEQLFTNYPNIATSIDPDDALELLGNRGTALWLVHGEYNKEQPFSSKIHLNDQLALTPADILKSAPSLSDLELLILVGCDGAIFDTVVEPTEQRGLSEPFLTAGVRQLVVPSWRAETLASFIFTSHLVKSLSDGATAPTAFRNATLFLRDSNMADIVKHAQGENHNLESAALLRLLQARAAAATDGLPPFADLSRYGSFKLMQGG